MGSWLLTLACLAGHVTVDTTRAVEQGLSWLGEQRHKVKGKSWRERTLVIYVLSRARRLGLKATAPEELARELMAHPTDGSVYQESLVLMAGAELLGLEGLESGKVLEAHLAATAQSLVKVAIRNKGRLYWSYPAGRGDLSNTQYATLGLHALEVTGSFRAPEGVWEGIFRSYMDFQEPGGPTLRGPSAGTAAEATTADRAARGWGYSCLPGRRGSTGSMTAAGLAGLAVARGHLLERKVLSKKDATDSSEALQAGWAALGRTFNPSSNPGGSQMWWSYYLATVERCGSLAGITHLGACDWYAEGAKVLVRIQNPKGLWYLEHSPTVDTSFCLLFLMRGTPPLAPDVSHKDAGVNRYDRGR